MTKTEYQHYLKTSHWQTKRREALEHFGSICYVCEATTRLNVHHKTYKRIDSGFGNEKVGDLCILCQECHYLSHQFRRRPMKKKQLRRAKAIMLLGFDKEYAFMHCADGQFTRWRKQHNLPRSVSEWGVFGQIQSSRNQHRVANFAARRTSTAE